LLKYIVDEHNRCCVIVHRVNGNMRFIFCLFYFISIPAVDLLIILSIKNDIDTIHRIWTSVLCLIAFTLLYFVNHSFSIVSREAHRPYIRLNSIIASRPATRILILKVLGLIEKLSGPVIGIYCQDFFPFTNYEFYLYITNLVQNLLLFIGLFGV